MKLAIVLGLLVLAAAVLALCNPRRRPLELPPGPALPGHTFCDDAARALEVESLEWPSADALAARPHLVAFHAACERRISLACLAQPGCALEVRLTAQHEAYALPALDPPVVWTLQARQRIVDVLPAADGSAVVTIEAGGEEDMIALDAGGRERWRRRFDLELGVMEQLDDLLVVDHGDDLLALDPATGHTVWQRSLPGVGSHDALGRRLLVIGGDGQLYLVDHEGRVRSLGAVNVSERPILLAAVAVTVGEKVVKWRSLDGGPELALPGDDGARLDDTHLAVVQAGAVVIHELDGKMLRRSLRAINDLEAGNSIRAGGGAVAVPRPFGAWIWRPGERPRNVFFDVGWVDQQDARGRTWAGALLADQLVLIDGLTPRAVATQGAPASAAAYVAGDWLFTARDNVLEARRLP